ncbi:hypothetical protein [Oryza sativa Japonica Group]|uniref:Uncharacterized protein n=1 Tax=Oryza sativa subsp. japonica TaxID=39947 RepID=Q9LE78_ORYSJ|nr:hypothetical protein [Oryza sativa Japonica Group]BAA96197.1 hypothetical protein [Oryza sativa Japonica Group]
MNIQNLIHFFKWKRTEYAARLVGLGRKGQLITVVAIASPFFAVDAANPSSSPSAETSIYGMQQSRALQHLQ